MEYYIKAARLVPGKAVRVFAKDENSKPCGEYDGYWTPERGTVSLYPAKGSWIYGKLNKHVISERLVRRSAV